MEIITAVKGFKDILPQETGKWRYIEEIARKIFTDFGFREIRIPILEKTELFKRGHWRDHRYCGKGDVHFPRPGGRVSDPPS